MQSLPEYDLCCAAWANRGFVPLAELFALAAFLGSEIDAQARRLCLAFNGSAGSIAAIRNSVCMGDDEAANLAAWMDVHGQNILPARMLSMHHAEALRQRFDADPEGFIARSSEPYPLLTETNAWGFDADWVTETLARSRDRMTDFIAQRRSDVAVLIGNGPSLRHVSPDQLWGKDVFISNYAVRHRDWRHLARGLAVTNRLVAEQEPYAFQLPQMWKFHPLWLGHVLRDSSQAVFLNALGGPMFFSTNVLRRVAWHATVSFFWLQILYHAGYRRVVMTGFDNSYQQPKGLREGTLLHQDGDDQNHFDPAYFRGKVWQSADTRHMSQTYQLARAHFAADGRDIINSTIGGHLDDFPRMPLADAIRMQAI